MEVQTPEKFEAQLTDKGKARLEKKDRDLKAGEDYVIKEDGGDGWLPLGKGQKAIAYRHDWIIVPRPRPHIPVVYGAQSSRTVEEQAMRILVLFFAWVNDASDASPTVPFIQDLWRPGMKDWKEALLAHASAQGFPTLDVKRYVMNSVFTYCLPRQTRILDDVEENSDNESLADDLHLDFQLDEEDLLPATLTHVRGSGRKETAADDTLVDSAEADDPNEAQEPAAATRLYDMTMDMFKLTDKIWQKQEDNRNTAAQERHMETLRRAAACELDHEVAKQAARKSSKDGDKVGTGSIGLMGAELEVGPGLKIWAVALKGSRVVRV